MTYTSRSDRYSTASSSVQVRVLYWFKFSNPSPIRPLSVQPEPDFGSSYSTLFYTRTKNKKIILSIAFCYLDQLHLSRKTIEEIGIEKKSMRDFPPKPKQSFTQDSIDRSRKIIQHFSRQISFLGNSTFSYLLPSVLGKTDIDSRSNSHRQKRCILCHMNKIRKMTILAMQNL